MKKKTLSTIHYAIAIMTVISCSISISNNDIYQDGEWANAQWLGQDIVSLCLALPLLLIGFSKAIKGHTKWQILNCGLLLYFIYTYSFYMFAAKLTFLYLFHVPIFGLSIFAFFISCIDLFNQDLHFNLPRKGLTLTIIIYLAVIALMITGIWLVDIFSHLTDPGHQSATPDGEAPLIIYSLDLGIILPLMFITAFLLYKKTQQAYLLGGIILTKTSTLGFSLMAMSLSMYLQDLNPEIFLIFLWSTIGVLGSVLTYAYLRNLKVRKLHINETSKTID